MPLTTVTVEPAARSTPLAANGAARIFGPGRSARTATTEPVRSAASRTACNRPMWSESGPWLRLRRTTSTPGDEHLVEHVRAVGRRAERGHDLRSGVHTWLSSADGVVVGPARAASSPRNRWMVRPTRSSRPTVAPKPSTWQRTCRRSISTQSTRVHCCVRTRRHEIVAAAQSIAGTHLRPGCRIRPACPATTSRWRS